MKDIVGCCSLERAPAAVDAALQCIIQMTAAPALQVVKLFPFAAFISHVGCCMCHTDVYFHLTAGSSICSSGCQPLTICCLAFLFRLLHVSFFLRLTAGSSTRSSG